MHILIIKTSSLGDVIHTLPALTDASQQQPALQCDWVVEEAFAEIPTWHPAVNQVIPVALRQWRQRPWQAWSSGAWQQFIQALTQRTYDRVIDAQGLLKSALLTYLARGQRCGLDRHSARESLAALAYQQRYAVPKEQHAITRVRQLLAAVLNYTLPNTLPDYGIINHFLPNLTPIDTLPTIVFLHGTTWRTKHWPESYWIALAQRVTAAGYQVRLPWGNAHEYTRAQKLATIHPNIRLMPQQNLSDLVQELVQAQAVVGVDTGLAHLAAALAIPSVTLYGATQPTRTGTYGYQQKHLPTHFPCAPCFRKQCIYQGASRVFPACYEQLSVEQVWEVLQELLSQGKPPSLSLPA